MIGQLVGEIVLIFFKGLVFLAIGFALEFNWLFWLLVLGYILRPFRYIDPLVHRFNNYLNNLTEKLRQNRLKNHPPP